MNPQPMSLVLLLLVLPGVGWAAAALARPLLPDRVLYRLLTPLLAIALWLVAVALVARRTSSLNWGLWIGTLSLALAGALAKWRELRSPPTDPPAPEQEAARPPSVWMVRTAVLVTIPIAILAFGGDFYDEDSHNGHLSIISQMQEDRYPPPNECFPDLPLHYHYGFDLASAGLTAMTRVPIHVAMDVLTVFFWVWTWCLLWVLGDRLGGAGTGGWVALATLLGSGAATFLVLLGVPFESLELRQFLGNHPWLAGKYSGPPVIGYFFQKPFSMGAPFAVALMLLAQKALPKWRIRREALMGLLLAALSLSQALFFVALLPTVTVTEIVSTRRFRFLATAGAVVVIAAAMGGMLFTPLPKGAETGLQFRVWVLAEGVLPVLGWHLSTLGALLPIGLAGFFLVRGQMRLFLALLVGGSLVTLNLAEYQYTWDIIKFATIAAVALGILSGLVLGRLAARRSWKARLALAAAVLALTTTSTAYVTARTTMLFPAERPRQDIPTTDDDIAAARWLRRHAASGELVYAPMRSDFPYVQNAVQLVWPVSNFSLAFGAPLHRIVERRLLFVTVTPEIVEPYLAQGLRWIVMEEGAEHWMRDRLDRWLREGSAEQVATFGRLRLYRLAEPDSLPGPAEVSGPNAK